jgi:hypothetical protein
MSIITFLIIKNNICIEVTSILQCSKMKGGKWMPNKIRTSKPVARKASRQLRSKVTTPATKSVAGSALRNRCK